jgi:hypothetical protein
MGVLRHKLPQYCHDNATHINGSVDDVFDPVLSALSPGTGFIAAGQSHPRGIGVDFDYIETIPHRIDSFGKFIKLLGRFFALRANHFFVGNCIFDDFKGHKAFSMGTVYFVISISIYITLIEPQLHYFHKITLFKQT